uniref:Biogenesis of lysosome-related organelles complex 1 subunit 7 n=1 Tax=Plectus sambesii TaxID=2011161 RepID=A0A914WJB5_9BILA
MPSTVEGGAEASPEGDAGAERSAAEGASSLGSGRAHFAEGLMSLLRPVVTELDSRIRTTRSSQIQLRQQIDRLAEDLRNISDNYQAPYDLEGYVRKLQDSRKRVAVVSSILQNAQERLVKLQRNIAKDTERRKSLLEGAAPPAPM